jgi:hypothetical protein
MLQALLDMRKGHSLRRGQAAGPGHGRTSPASNSRCSRS